MDRFRVQKGLYVYDSSAVPGQASELEAVSRRVDALFKDVEDRFDPSKIRPLTSHHGEAEVGGSSDSGEDLTDRLVGP